MKWSLLFFFWVIPKLLAAQTDTMIVELMDGNKKAYSILAIKDLTFNSVIASTEDLERMSTILQSFTLKQNYPNPFNPTTTIEYEIPHTGDVEVSIFDVQGKKVKELEKRMKESGSYKAVWDSRDNAGQSVSSGTYFYRVQFNGSQLVNKLLLLK